MSLPSHLFPYRKQSKLSVNGGVPGVAYNRYQSGHRPASAPTSQLGSPFGHADYMLAYPDEYIALPGHVQHQVPHYEPYDPGPAHHFTPMLHAPQPSFPAPDEIAYGDALITDELMHTAMEEVHATDDGIEALPFDQDVMAEGIMGAPDLVNAYDVDDLAEATAKALMDGPPLDGLDDPCVDRSPNADATLDSLDAMLQGADANAMLDLSGLEQIVACQDRPDLLPSPAFGELSFPQPLDEDPLLNPWGMPGWGPMGPEMGPMM